MAKRGGKEALRVALVLDLDDYEKGLAKARTDGHRQAVATSQVWDQAANKIARRFFSIDAAVRIAERGFKAFVATAEKLDKSGQGDEGTAAVARLSQAVDTLWVSFVKAVTQTSVFKFGVAVLSSIAEGAAKVFTNFGAAIQVAAGTLQMFGGVAADLIGVILDKLSSFVTSVGQLLQKIGLESVGGGIAAAGAAGQIAADRIRSFALAQMQAGDERRRTGMGDLANTQLPSAENHSGAFMRSVDGTVNAFMGSWQGGLRSVGKLFEDFAGKAGTAFEGISKQAGAALGEMFDAMALTGQLFQKVYGQSEDAAKKFEAAQLSIIGVLAVAKSLMAIGDAKKAIGDKDPFSAAGYIAASVAYGAAATLAGIAANRALSSGGGGVGDSPGAITNPDNFGKERKQIIVVVQNAIGGAEFVREELIPEINKAAGDGATVVASYATNSGRVDPGSRPGGAA